MKCILLMTIISLNASAENNTLPRSWQISTHNTHDECVQAAKHRQEYNKWYDFTDEQGKKKSKSECVCFE